MIRSDLFALTAIGGLLGALALLAGPMIGIGAVLGLAMAALIYRVPTLGLAFMVLTGTTLQVLGSEHLTGLPLSLGKAAGVLTLLAWLARSLVHRLPLTYSPQLPALLAFALSLLLSAVFARDQALAQEGLFRYAQLFLLFFMIASIAGESKRALEYACIALTASMAVSSVIGLFEFFVPALAIESDDPSLVQGMIGAIVDRDSLEGVEIKRITGGLSDSNLFAYTLVSVLPLNLHLFHRYRGPAQRALILLAAALQGVGIVLSFTRSAIIALAVVVLVLLIRRRLSLRPVLLAGILGALAFATWNPPGLQRLFSPEYARAGSTPLRSMMLRGGVALIMERPIAGYGYSGFGPAFIRWLRDKPVDEAIEIWERELQNRVAADEERLEWVMPHNTVVQLWVEYGVIGFAAFTGFLCCILLDLRVGARYGPPALGELSDCLLAGVLGFLACAAFGHLALLKIVWILGGLAAALRRVALRGADAPMVP